MITRANKLLKANIAAAVKLVNPVRPPAPIPDALSTKVVTFDVPQIAATIEPAASENNDRSIFDLNPFPLKNSSSSA